MTDENQGDSIETLASRAKEMLERVRGAADPDALTPPPLPLSTLRDKRADDDITDDVASDEDIEEVVDDTEANDTDSNDTDIEDTVETDDGSDLEVDAGDSDVDSADEREADDDALEAVDVDADQVDSDLDDVDLDDADLDEVDDADLEISDAIILDPDDVVIDEVALAEAPAIDDSVHDAEDEPDDDVAPDDDSAADEAADDDLESLADPFDDETAADEATEGSLNLFGRKDERDVDESSDDDLESEAIDDPVEEAAEDDDEIGDADAVIADLEEIEQLTSQSSSGLLDIDAVDSVDVNASVDVDGDVDVESPTYLGDVDLPASSISTDDLVSEPDAETNSRIEKVVGLDLDVPSDGDTDDADDTDSNDGERDGRPALTFASKPKAAEPETDDSNVVRGSAIVAGSAAAAAAVSAATSGATKKTPESSAPEPESAPTETQESAAARRRGRLSDLGPKETPATPQPQSKGRFSGRRRPAVDHDLNELFLKPGAPDQSANQRSYPWLVPLGFIVFCILAISVLFFSWWAAGGGNSNDSTPAVETTDSATETTSTATTPTTVATTNTSSSAAAVDETTTTSEEVEETDTAPTFESAADLIGVGSNTADFAELGAPLGLGQALEQLKVDENGDPVKFTLLAPSDGAIAKLSEDQLNALAADPNKARELIDYHFIDQPLTPELLQQSVGGQIMTRSGVPIFVELLDGDFVFNGDTRIEIAGLEAENGSVIVIDSVLSPPTINKLLDLGNIQFKVISSVITDAGKTELQKAVTYFTENPDAKALIAGHTDTDGEAEANRRLSQRRAEAVRQFLIDAGIDGSRLEAQGFGEDEPILVDGVEDKNLSRRIEFILQ